MFRPRLGEAARADVRPGVLRERGGRRRGRPALQGPGLSPTHSQVTVVVVVIAAGDVVVVIVFFVVVIVVVLVVVFFVVVLVVGFVSVFVCVSMCGSIFLPL